MAWLPPESPVTHALVLIIVCSLDDWYLTVPDFLVVVLCGTNCCIQLHREERRLMSNTVTQAASTASQSSTGTPAPRTTEVMVILTARKGVSREQIMKIMPAEVRATVRLYLDGKIRQWYSRGDGRGVIFFLDAENVDQAHAIIDTLPLSKESLMDHEYIPVGPLLPLGGLISAGAV